MLIAYEISCIYIFVFESAYFNLRISCIFKTFLRSVILAPSKIQQKGSGSSNTNPYRIWVVVPALNEPELNWSWDAVTECEPNSNAAAPELPKSNADAAVPEPNSDAAVPELDADTVSLEPNSDAAVSEPDSDTVSLELRCCRTGTTWTANSDAAAHSNHLKRTPMLPHWNNPNQTPMLQH